MLAGGLGTRMHPYTTVLPKPLVPVGGRPILELILRWLAAAGVERVDVCIGHLGQLIRTYFSEADAIPEGLQVHWHWETEPRGTAGALGSITDLDESLLVVNGDVLTDMDPGSLLAFHEQRGAALTIATRSVEVQTDVGAVEHEDGLVVNYREKPVIAYQASMGVYVYAPWVIAGLSPDVLQLPDLVLDLLKRGERVAAYVTRATWSHIGTLEQHREATRLLENL
ncbi:MAG: nucleotidyltransferase family protein [Solirubrobacteraceae bacterium]